MDDRLRLRNAKPCGVVFVVWWLILLALHAVNVVYYVSAARAYKGIKGSGLELEFTIYGIGVPHIDAVTILHCVVAEIHCVLIGAMVIGTLSKRQLAFRPDLYRALHVVQGIVKQRTVPGKDNVGQNGSQASRHQFAASRLVTFCHAIVGRDGVFGVDSPHFDQLHLARELLEISLQSLQAYKMASRVDRAMLYRCYVALLVFNCWSTPFLHLWYRRDSSRRRMLSLLSDAVIDIFSSMGVSLWIFLFYSDQYVDSYNGFGTYVWFVDVWFARMQPDFELMMASSWSDMISRLVFAFGLLQCIEGVKDLLDSNANHLVPLQFKLTAVVPGDQPTVGPQIVVASTSLFKRATMALFVLWGW